MKLTYREDAPISGDFEKGQEYEIEIPESGGMVWAKKSSGASVLMCSDKFRSPDLNPCD